MSNTNIGCPIIDESGVECLIKAQTERIKELERELERAKQVAELAKLDTKDIIHAISTTFGMNGDLKQRCVMHVAEQLSETCNLMEESTDAIFGQMVWHMLDCVAFSEVLGVDVNQVDVLEKYARDGEVRKRINSVIYYTLGDIIQHTRKQTMLFLMERISYMHER